MPTKFIREKLAVIAVNTQADKKFKNQIKSKNFDPTPITVKDTEDMVFGSLSFYIKDSTPRSRRFFSY